MAMRDKPILFVAAILLALAAVAVPLLLHQLPLPLRLISGFINLLAAFAVTTVIRQSGPKKTPPTDSEKE